MAKARQKKSTSNAKSKGSGFNGAAIFLIVAIAALLAIYAWRENPNWKDDLSKITSKDRIASAPSATKAKEQTPTTSKTTVSNSAVAPPKKNTSSQSKFEENKIDAQNGAIETAAPNKSLPVYTKDDNYYYASSFDFAWPAYDQKDAIVEHTYYTLCYNEKTEQADWIAYKLTKVNLENAKFKRKDNFRKDPDVKTTSATPEDYKGSGYDRGHLAPAADFTWTKEGMSESFYMSNMSPQEPGFNRGIWKKLEENVRKWAKSNEEVFVVTGPIFKGKNEKIGKNKVVVPDQYYKVVLELTGKEVKGIGFILDNKKSSEALKTYAVSIDQVEGITGLDFFPNIPDALENKIESTFNYALWE